MRRSFHSNFDDDGHLMLTSPVHKEVRLDENGGSGRIDMKSHLLNRIMDEKRSDSADHSDNYKQNRIVKERFYEFYKQAQGLDANYYFNGIRKNLLTKMEKILSPEQLCETFEKLNQKAIINLKNAKKVWTDEENVFLVSLITYYTQINDEDFNSISDSGWKYIAEMFPAKKQDQIKAKWQTILKITVTKVPWSTTEDDLLSQIISEKGNKRQWKEIANELNSRSGSDVFRHGKQCRERWINHLDPEMNRGAWTLEEDAKLLQSFLQVGKKWAEIAKRVGQRTENSVKNRWNSLMKKYKNEYGFDTAPDVGDDNDKELSWQKKVVQLALESFSSLPFSQTSSLGTNRTQTAELEQNAPVRDSIKREPLVGFLDSTSLNQQQQLQAALLAQMNNGFNANYGNQNIFLNPLGMSPLARNQFQGQFSGTGTPQNQLQQSSGFDGFLPNWQNMNGVSGMSPMNQSFGGYSPMSNFPGFVNFQGYPNFQNMSNMQQILQNPVPVLNATPTNSNSGDLLGFNNTTPKNLNTQTLPQGRQLSSHLGVIRESYREDRSDKASLIDESFVDNQAGGSGMLLKERPFDDFSQSTIENHNLQFAVVDLTKNELRNNNEEQRKQFLGHLSANFP